MKAIAILALPTLAYAFNMNSCSSSSQIQSLVSALNITTYDGPPERKLIVFDLDNTIMQSIVVPSEHIHEFKKTIGPLIGMKLSPTANTSYMGIVWRPGMRRMIHELSAGFDIGIFSANDERYCDAVIKVLGLNVPKENRKYRQHLSNRRGNFGKNVDLFNRGQHNTILIDDLVLNFPSVSVNGTNVIWNGINVKPFDLMCHRYQYGEKDFWVPGCAVSQDVKQSETEYVNNIKAAVSLLKDVSDVRPYLADISFRQQM